MTAKTTRRNNSNWYRLKRNNKLHWVHPCRAASACGLEGIDLAAVGVIMITSESVATDEMCKCCRAHRAMFGND